MMKQNQPNLQQMEDLKEKLDSLASAMAAKQAELSAMEAALRESSERERKLQMEMASLKASLQRARDGEEMLASEIAVLEAEAHESAIASKQQLQALSADLQDREAKLSAIARQLYSLLSQDLKHIPSEILNLISPSQLLSLEQPEILKGKSTQNETLKTTNNENETLKATFHPRANAKVKAKAKAKSPVSAAERSSMIERAAKRLHEPSSASSPSTCSSVKLSWWPWSFLSSNSHYTSSDPSSTRLANDISHPLMASAH